MSKYTAEQVIHAADLEQARYDGDLIISEYLRDYATLLRERELAKAVVTDDLDYVPGELDRTAPVRIWLQIDTVASSNDREEPWPGCDDVTWQDESIGGLEIQYVRADLASARVPDGWRTIMQEKPAGATHYMVQPKWEHGQLMVGVRWFKPWKNGGYAEWCTDCDNEYPAFRVLNILDLSPTSITAAPKPETEE